MRLLLGISGCGDAGYRQTGDHGHTGRKAMPARPWGSPCFVLQRIGVEGLQLAVEEKGHERLPLVFDLLDNCEPFLPEPVSRIVGAAGARGEPADKGLSVARGSFGLEIVATHNSSFRHLNME
ncbi:MAG TPA: hypothetical protein VNQ56_13010 [Pseudolabrys sp.]|nr:hypothetical protein [Pseudolabrys sp.]